MCPLISWERNTHGTKLVSLLLFMNHQLSIHRQKIEIAVTLDFLPPLLCIVTPVSIANVLPSSTRYQSTTILDFQSNLGFRYNNILRTHNLYWKGLYWSKNMLATQGNDNETFKYEFPWMSGQTEYIVVSWRPRNFHSCNAKEGPM